MTSNPEPSPAAPAATSSDTSVTAAGTTPPSLVQRLAAEALGTFLLLFLGAGALAFGAAGLFGGDLGGSVGDLGPSPLTYALALTAAGYAFARISGGHFNPAVSLAGALAGRLSWKDAGAYAGAQVGGGILAGLVLFVLILGFEDSDAEVSLFQSGFGDSFSGYAWWAALLLEILLTVVFVHVVLAVTDGRHEHRAFAPLAVGLGYGAVVFAGAAATGGVANPARAIATNLFGGVDAVLSMLLIVVATLIGGVIAGLTYPLLFGRDAEAVAGSGLKLGGGGSRRSSGQDAYAAWGQQGQQGWYGDQQQGQQWGQQQGWYGDQQGWGQQPGQQPGQQQGWYGEQQPGQQGWEQQAQQQWGDQQAQQPQQQWGQQQADPYQPDPYQPGQHQAQPEQDPGSEGGHTRMRPDQG